MYDRTAIMKRAWANYRDMTRYLRGAPFDRKLFADVLRYVWGVTKRVARSQAEEAARRAQALAEFNAKPAAPVAPLSELEQRIDDLKYLSARYDIGRMAIEMRAEHARRVGAAR